MIWNTHTHFAYVHDSFPSFHRKNPTFSSGKIQTVHQKNIFFSHEQCKLVIEEISVCSPRNMFFLPWTIFQFPAEKHFIRWEHHCFIAKLRLSHHEIPVIPPFLMVKSTIYQQFISQPWYISPICRRFSQRTKPPYSSGFPSQVWWHRRTIDGNTPIYVFFRGKHDKPPLFRYTYPHQLTNIICQPFC